MAEQDFYRKGFQLLKSYANLNIIVQVLGLGSLLASVAILVLGFLVTPFSSTSQRPPVGIPSFTPLLIALSIVGVVVALASIILYLVAVYGRLIPGAETLSKWRSALASSAVLIKYGYWAALVLGILAIVVFLAFVPVTELIGKMLSPTGPGTMSSQSVLLAFISGLLGASLLLMLSLIHI